MRSRKGLLWFFFFFFMLQTFCESWWISPHLIFWNIKSLQKIWREKGHLWSNMLFTAVLSVVAFRGTTHVHPQSRFDACYCTYVSEHRCNTKLFFFLIKHALITVLRSCGNKAKRQPRSSTQTTAARWNESNLSKRTENHDNKRRRAFKLGPIFLLSLFRLLHIQMYHLLQDL